MLAHWLWGLAGCRADPPAVGVGLLSCWPTGCGGLPAVMLAHRLLCCPTGCGCWPAVVLAHRLWGLAGCRADPPAVGGGPLSC